MSDERNHLSALLSGRFDVLLAAALAALSVVAHLSRGVLWPMVFDLLACIAAALTTRWPKTAGVGLGLALLGMLVAPGEWASMGEYAALIPILGTGLRGQRRERFWMTVAYGAILVGLTYQDMPGDPVVVFAVGVWVALIAVLWGIGDLFNALRHAQEQAQASVLQQQRMALARDLHDTVARELTRASLQAQIASSSNPSAEISEAVDGIQRASAQLRWMLALLRDPRPSAASETLDRSTGDTLKQATTSLEARGFPVVATIDGDIDDLPEALGPTVRAAIGEACANIEHHGAPRTPCAVIVSNGPSTIDMVFINQVRSNPPEASRQSMGLAGTRERLALVGGDLTAGQKGSQWITRITIPV